MVRLNFKTSCKCANSALTYKGREWPTPNVFVFDITSFFYPQVKAAVEGKFPHLKPAKLVGYNAQPAFQILLYVRSI